MRSISALASSMIADDELEVVFNSEVNPFGRGIVGVFGALVIDV